MEIILICSNQHVLQHHFSWICALNSLNIGLVHISVMDFFSEREEEITFLRAGVNSLNKRHISHHEIRIEGNGA